MRLFIKNLENKDGYLVCHFEGGKFLGEDDDRIAIVGDDPSANFEIAISRFERGIGKQYIIYQTPKNWPYKTYGAIIEFRVNEQQKVYFRKDQLDCIEVLSQECHFRKDETLERRYILKVELTEEHPTVFFYTDEKDVKSIGRKKYIVTKETVMVEEDNEVINYLRTSIMCLPYLKLEQQIPSLD